VKVSKTHRFWGRGNQPDEPDMPVLIHVDASTNERAIKLLELFLNTTVIVWSVKPTKTELITLINGELLMHVHIPSGETNEVTT